MHWMYTGIPGAIHWEKSWNQLTDFFTWGQWENHTQKPLGKAETHLDINPTPSTGPYNLEASLNSRLLSGSEGFGTHIWCPYCYSSHLSDGLQTPSSKVTEACIQMCAPSLSCVQLFAASWTAAHQAPLSTEFSKKEYWNKLPFPTPGDLLETQALNPCSWVSCTGRPVLYNCTTWGAPTPAFRSLMLFLQRSGS